MANYPLDIGMMVVFALVQWRISRLLVAAYPRRWLRPGLAGFAVLLAAGYALMFSNFQVQLGVPARIGCVLGAGALTYCLTVSAALAVHEALVRMRRVVRAEVNPSRRRILNTAGHALMTAPFAAVAYGALVQRTDFRVRELDISLAGLPPDLDGLRILHLSDIHLSAFLSEREFARVVDACRELRPHLAAITGDLVSGHNDPIDACIRQLARLRTDAGIFACLGNHERYIGAEDYVTRQAARQGIGFLRGQARLLRFGNATLNLAGLDFQPQRNRPHYLTGAQRLVVPGATNILLQHNPDVFPAAGRMGFHLLLAGHTHGGQVTVEILDRAINPAAIMTPYVYGLYRRGNAAAYVTRGIGTIGIPARIGAPPEISLLRLRKA